ncbi:MAG: phosphoribosyl-AMP cyclohydrolase [Oscillospiraceae bacterium]|nr:phosphoribosyl-AMP cyclohydrolase [Oscillospiraceae bacterium]
MNKNTNENENKNKNENEESIPDAYIDKGAGLSKLFIKSELIPAIIREQSTGDILMLAYMNEESLKKTLETGKTWFYSRSRSKLWNKGETSGHFQYVREIRYDCDFDTLLITVKQIGPACHTGEKSCFFNILYKSEDENL